MKKQKRDGEVIVFNPFWYDKDNEYIRFRVEVNVDVWDSDDAEYSEYLKERFSCMAKFDKSVKTDKRYCFKYFFAEVAKALDKKVKKYYKYYGRPHKHEYTFLQAITSIKCEV